MKKFGIFFTCFLVIFAVSCKTAKKAQRVQKQIAKKDTAKIVLVTPNTQSIELDSLHDMLSELDKHQIKGYSTFSAKVKVDYQGTNNNGQATANIRMREDSIIWISLTGPFGIEGYRVMIQPDSILLMDKLHHRVLHKSIDYLQKILEIPISFNDLQNIIIGNPIFIQGPISSYKHTPHRWYVSIEGKIFKNFITVVDNNRKLILKHSLLQDSTIKQNRKCDITYSGYQLKDDKHFSETRKISISDKTNLEIKLQFKDYNFGLPLSFPFSIPKSYDWK
ncbi:MAG TPA: DUF4292 domain-containing protein [Arachidicoccus soli]|nr:DUF4292 domain-containing protein [Arachidicoccus soli]